MYASVRKYRVEPEHVAELRAGADASAVAAAEFVTEGLADLGVDRLEAAAGEVSVSR
jgi:hypothetical protein